MSEELARRLAEERRAARAIGDFAAADALRERIEAAGFAVVDTPSGYELSPAPADGAHPERVHRRSGEVPSVIGDPPSRAASVLWLDDGWPEDVARGVASFDRHHPGADLQHVVAVSGARPGAAWPEDVEVVRVDPAMGWSAARNAAIRRAAGAIVLVVDGSVEAAGDVVGPLTAALADATVGLAGPFGIVSEDLREFRESAGPEVDAVEGYLMAVARDLLVAGLRFDERFRFYRSADIELSFQVKARGRRAVVVPVPVRRHEHRRWAATPEDRRMALSKRNFYRFLDRWRGREDLLVARSRGAAPPDG